MLSVHSTDDSDYIVTWDQPVTFTQLSGSAVNTLQFFAPDEGLWIQGDYVSGSGTNVWVVADEDGNTNDTLWQFLAPGDQCIPRPTLPQSGSIS